MNIVASIFNLAGPDLIFILLFILIFFGAKRLPELARGLGQAINEFNKAKEDVHRQISRADEPVVQRPAEIQERTSGTTVPAAPSVASAPQPPPPVPGPGAAQQQQQG